MESSSRYTVEQIATAIGGQLHNSHPSAVIDHLLIDSRKILFPQTSLFFALRGPRRDGHQFIPDLHKQGVRNFVVEQLPSLHELQGAGFILVSNTLDALQQLAAFHRKHFNFPVIAITGSNGKTIVKEWLNQLLQNDFKIVRSPRSFNSQVGVPLSIWQINKEHNLGIFEAGISLPSEMDRLEKIISPDFGIFTNLGEAHQEGFSGFRQKAIEKFVLFRNCKKLVYCKDSLEGILDPEGKDKSLLPRGIRVFSWSRKSPATLQIKKEITHPNETRIEGIYRDQQISIQIPFTDKASIDNSITCCCVMLELGYDQVALTERIKTLKPVTMRLELKKGINNCSIINDSYVADLDSLRIALDFLKQQRQHASHTVILSDFLQTGMAEGELYEEVARALYQRKIDRLVAIGSSVTAHKDLLEPAVSQSEFYLSTEDFIHQFHPSRFRDEGILIKGARVFQFEQVDRLLEQKIHQTVLEINLGSLVHNLKQYQKLLLPQTKIMAMVKAFSYGSGSYEIANILQFHKIDYLAVAYADEGIELRKAGISLPIMVMNPEENSFDAFIDYNLEAEIFSFHILNAFEEFLKAEGVQEFPVHIKIDTGMHRLGFEENEMEELCRRLSSNNIFKIQSTFSHLAAGEDPNEDEFTSRQAKTFVRACEQLEQSLGYTFLRHIANSAAIARHPELQMDMVRIGIGLYGVDSAHSGKLELKEVAKLKTTIAQIKNIKKGDTVGYNRKGITSRESKIATIRIGYADGFRRSLGNGVGKILVNGILAPVIGNIAMDMAMIDITGIEKVKEGDEVIIFGEGITIIELANWAGTNAYEIMTGISQRVQRVYFEE